MILTCPNCSTRYMIKDDAVGDNGRTVRCSKCSTSWFVAAEPDTLALDDHVEPEITEVETSRDDGDDADFSEELRKSDEVMNELTSGAHVSIRDKADQDRRRRRIFGVTMIWVTTLALLAIAATLAYVFRQPIVEKFPQASNIYQAFGVQVSATGLILDAPQTAYITVEGEPHLVVNGTVQNLTKKPKVIPLVKLSILNRNDEEITHWYVQPSPINIPAKGRVDFAAEFPNPPVDAASLTYKLAVDEEG